MRKEAPLLYARIRSLGIKGIGGYEVELETSIASGLPRLDMVGLPDAAVKEAADRVRAAIKHNGWDFPVSRITVNLAPADTTTCRCCWASWPPRGRSSPRRRTTCFSESCP